MSKRMLDVTFLTRNQEYREGRYYLAQRKYITGLDIMSKLDHWEGRYLVALSTKSLIS